MQHDAASDGVRDEEATSQEEGNQLMDSTNRMIKHSGPSERKLDLSLQIPTRLVGSSNNRGLLASKLSFKGGLSPRSLLKGLSFKHKAATPEGERRSLLNPDPTVVPESSYMANSSPELLWNGCVSLPVTPASNLSPSVSTPTTTRKWAEQQKSCKGEVTVKKVSRSLSVPSRNVVIVRSMSFSARKEHGQSDLAVGEITPANVEDEDEEIPEEEAVCRICLIELSEGGNTLKTECSCKGDLRLTHEECAVKWFSIKGNRKCDICGQEITNLPVTLLRVQSSVPRANRQENNRQGLSPQSTSDWKDLVTLVLISTLCYFFFLEQMLVSEMKSHAILVAAPFSFTLGVIGSIFAVILAIKEHAWTYATLEFLFVAVTLHLLYSLLHLNPVYSILLSSFLGFGMAMTLNSLFLRMYAWVRQAQPRQAQASLV